MEPLNHFEAVVLAAGVSCVYNADDWHRATEAAADDAAADGEGSATH